MSRRKGPSGDDVPPGPWSTTPRAPQRRAKSWRLLVIGTAFMALVGALVTMAPPRAWEGYEIAYVFRALLIGSVVVLWLAYSPHRLSTLAMQLAIWGGLFILVVIAYSYRFEFHRVADRVIAELVPGRGRLTDERTVAFPLARDGHYWADATADGVALHLMVDTGASGIILSKTDAARLGLRDGALEFNEVFSTANGKVRAARVELETLTIGPIVLRSVTAWITGGDLPQSLLGMGFLSRMTSVELRNSVLTIRQ
jgi:aspartyl protease family protein